jgi:hypothetical protein
MIRPAQPFVGREQASVVDTLVRLVTEKPNTAN